MVSRAPSGPMSQARAAVRLAPVLERAFAVAGAPLDGLVVPVASGPGKGIRMVGERRALAWISGGVEREVQEVLVRHLASGGTFVDVGASDATADFALVPGGVIEGVVLDDPTRACRRMD